MTVNEMIEMARKVFLENEMDYSYIGLRFEDKEREIGETCENSRHNLDREDERDFPEHGTEEYEEMFEMDGTSAWFIDENKKLNYSKNELEMNVHSLHIVNHAYIIAGNEITNTDDALDDGEIVIKDAVVLAKIF